MLHFTEEWSENFPYQLLIAAGVALVGLVLLAAVSFQCSSTWRWLINMTRHENTEDTQNDQTQQNAIRISHSLPDLQSEPVTHEYVQEQKDNKKVLSAKSIWHSAFLTFLSFMVVSILIFCPRCCVKPLYPSYQWDIKVFNVSYRIALICLTLSSVFVASKIAAILVLVLSRYLANISLIYLCYNRCRNVNVMNCHLIFFKQACHIMYRIPFPVYLILLVINQ